MSPHRRDPDETEKMADFLCFSIYSANLAFSRVYKPVLEQLGLTYPQYMTIISLWEKDQQTVTGLSDTLFLEPSTMTPMLKRLEAMGYLTRTRDTDDERIVRMSLTEAGRLLREKGIPLGEVTTDATDLNADQAGVLQKAISSLRDNLMKSSKMAA
jgi:DNA-binding MarR family transcriptional regulator